jgi:hypothetical protein
LPLLVRKKLCSVFLFFSLVGSFLPIYHGPPVTSISKHNDIDSAIPVTKLANKSPSLANDQHSKATTTNQSYDLTKIYDMNALHPNDILADGSALYVTSGNAGLFIYNVSDPTNPLLAYNYTDCDNAIFLSKINDLLLVVDQPSKLLVFNISTPFAPTKISQFYLPRMFFVNDIATTENYTFLTNNDGIIILNITNPYHPQLLTIYNDYISDYTGSRMIALRGHLAYVTHSTDQIFILDVSDPIRIRHLSTYTYVDGDFSELVFVDTFAYAASSLGLFILNFSSPTSPIVIDRIVQFNMDRIFVHDDLMFSGRSWLYFYNISNPLQPTYITSCSFSGDAESFAASQNYLFVSSNSGPNAITIFDLTNLPICFSVANITLGLSCKSVYFHKNILSLASGNTIFLYNFSNSSHPTYLNQFSISPFGILDFIVTDDYIYIATSTYYFHIYNISDPYSVTHLSETTIPKQISSFTIKDSYAFFGTKDDSLYTYNITNATSPALVNTFVLQGEINDLQFSGFYLYTSNYTSISIIDFSSIQNPILVNSYSSFSYLDTFLVVEDLLIVYGIYILQFFNITNPTSLSLINELEIHYDDYFNEFLYNDSFLYCFVHDKISVYDLHDLSSPQRSFVSNQEEAISDLAISGEYIFVVGFNDGLRIYTLTADISGPEFEHIYYEPAPAFSREEVCFYVYVTDPNGISNVILSLRINNDPWVNITMIKYYNTDRYSTYPRYFTAYDIVEFYFIAYDASPNNHSTVLLNNGGYFSFQIYFQPIPKKSGPAFLFSFILSSISMTIIVISSRSRKREKVIS